MSDPLFLADLRSLLSDRPQPLSDVLRNLRDGSTPSGRRWRNLRPDYHYESLVRDVEWCHVRTKKHGAGVAFYVAAVPFELPTREESGYGIVRRDVFGRVTYQPRNGSWSSDSSEARIWRTEAGARKALSAHRAASGWTVEPLTIVRHAEVR